MKNILLLFLLTALLIINTKAQTSIDYTVQVNVTVQTQPPKIIFNWDADANATSYSVARKLKSSLTWTIIASSLSGTATLFEDTSVAIGNAFEYRITKSIPNISAVTYLYSGIETPAIEQRGKIILLVDTTFSFSLANELEQLTQDFIGDGWQVIRHDVAPEDSVSYVKSLIVAEYNADVINTKAVFIVGHVPVPYSGDLNPDGHPDHAGAWPADVYYGEMNGNWTDISVNDLAGSRIENHNIPGDGKFDQTYIPTQVELQVGRIDFANMPAYSFTEEELLRRYLQKDHDYRVKNFAVRQRALVDDNFGAFGGEAFGSNGWRQCALVSKDSVSSQDYLTTLNSESYQWSYGCGGGSYTSCGGVGTTTDFVSDSLQTIFSMLFGSYFGDWDSQNNLMRASLASGALSCSWAGRPHWHYHHMALGEHIGYSALISQNNTSTYVSNYAGHYVHMAFMGDPTLRMHIISPPSNLTAIATGINTATLNWNASLDSVLGYYVYRLDTSTGFYVRISPSIIPATVFTDTTPVIYNNQYMVRAIRLEHSASGTYYNLSEGIRDSVLLANYVQHIDNTFSHLVAYPNPAREDLTIEFSTNQIENSIVEIYNPQGLKLQAINQKLSQGLNKIFIPVKNLSSGIYFVKVSAGKFSQTIKLSVVR